jgi:N utilization substance protein B
MNRTEAREAVFGLLFETEFRAEEATEEIFESSVDNREIEVNDYIRSTYFGVLEHVEELDGLIARHARGWKVSRIAPVTRTILRLCVYEMLYCADIPENVSLNEAIELCKKFDDEKARAFLNGVLNGAKDEILAARNG